MAFTRENLLLNIMISWRRSVFLIMYFDYYVFEKLFELNVARTIRNSDNLFF